MPYSIEIYERDLPLEDLPLENLPLENLPLENIPLENLPLEIKIYSKSTKSFEPEAIMRKVGFPKLLKSDSGSKDLVSK